MSKSPGKFVDLAALSMSGSLKPSVPVQILLKYNPPKLTVVYHFEHKENDQFYHDICFDRNMLENEPDEDIVSHLYMSEGYYFNPKILKRHQVLRLVNKLKSQLNNFVPSDKSPERHSIHSMGNSQSPMRHQGNIMGSPGYGQLQHNSSSGERRRKDRNSGGNNQYQQQQNTPFLGGNIDALPNRSPPRSSTQGGQQANQNSNNSNDNNQNRYNEGNTNNQNNQMPMLENQNKNFGRGAALGNTNQSNAGTGGQASQGGNSFQQLQQQSAFQRRKNFFERKRFLNYEAHNPMDFQNKTDPPQNSNSPPSNSRHGRGSLNQQENFNSSNFQNPLRPENHRSGKNQLAPLQNSPEMNRQGLVNQANQVNQNLMQNPRNGNQNGVNDRMPIDTGSPHLNNNNGFNIQSNNFYDNNQNQPQENQQNNRNNVQQHMNMYNDFRKGQQSNQQNNQSFENDDYNNQNGSQQYNNNSQGTLNDDQADQTNQFDGEGAQTDEQVSVYMKDNVIMRRIQIEGDEREFLMDPQGQIFDMNGQFIGTANTNELEELHDDSNNNQNQTPGNNYNNDSWNGQGQNNQQEVQMLLDDDDDIQGNQGMNNNNYTPGTGDVHNQGGNNNSLDGGTMDMDMEVMMQNA